MATFNALNPSMFLHKNEYTTLSDKVSPLVAEDVPQSGRYCLKYYSFTLICLSLGLTFADQNLLAPALSLVAKEFNFSDHDRDLYLGAHISGCFFIVGGLISLIVGYLADKFNRVMLYGLVIIVGETGTLMTYFSESYVELLFARTVTGIAIGGAGPIIYSMIPDLFRKQKRIFVITLVSIITALGIAAGQLLAGYICQQNSKNWRLPFLILSIPNICIAVFILLTATDPPRGLLEIDHSNAGTVGSWKHGIVVKYVESVSSNKLGFLLNTSSVRLIYAQGLVNCIPWSLIYTFLIDYLIHEKNEATMVSSVALSIFSLSGIFGQIFGGYIGFKLWVYDPSRQYQLLFVSASTFVAAIPLFIIIVTDDSSYILFVSCVFGGFLASIAGPNIKAILQAVTLPEIRGAHSLTHSLTRSLTHSPNHLSITLLGTGFSIFNLFDDIGKGFGPFVIVIIIRQFHGDRKKAFASIVSFWVLGALIQLQLHKRISSDEKNVTEMIAQSLHYDLSPSNPISIDT